MLHFVQHDVNGNEMLRWRSASQQKTNEMLHFVQHDKNVGT